MRQRPGRDHVATWSGLARLSRRSPRRCARRCSTSHATAPTQAQTQAAHAACQAQGLTPATDAFRQCVGKQLAGAQNIQSPPPNSGTPPPQAQAAIDSCKSQGLKPGSDAFNACIKAFSAAAAAAQHPSSSPNPAQQAAIAACKAKGLTENTDDFRNCIKDQTSTGAPNAAARAAIDRLQGERHRAGDGRVQGVRDRCNRRGVDLRLDGRAARGGERLQGAGIAFPSNAFSACLSKVFTKLLPNTAGGAKKDIAAATATCQAKHLTGSTALTDCLKAELNG